MRLALDPRLDGATMSELWAVLMALLVIVLPLWLAWLLLGRRKPGRHDEP